jgi:fucokinase
MHSGGYAKRLPAYSPGGKIFAPLPLVRPDGQIATLFDHLYVTLAGLASRLGPGLLVVAGDVFLAFDHRHVILPHPHSSHADQPRCTALTLRTTPEVAASHGVLATDPQGRVLRTLQKISPAEMAQAGLIDATGRVPIDTGILFFNSAALSVLTRLARTKNAPLPLDLYKEMVGAMTLEGRRAARGFLRPLANVELGALHVDGEFLHLGTSRQYRDAITGRQQSPAGALFQSSLHARVTSSPHPLAPTSRVYHANIDGVQLGSEAVIEHSLIDHSPAGIHRIGNGSVVSQVLWRREGKTKTPVLRLPDNTIYFQCPLERTDRETTEPVAHIVCSVEDAFGSDHYFGEPLTHWMRARQVKPADLWPRGVTEKTLWTARLFPVTDARVPCELALRLCTGRLPTAAWRAAPRVSLQDVLWGSSPLAIVAHREAVAANLQAHDVIHATHDGVCKPLGSDFYQYSTLGGYREAERVLLQHGTQTVTTPLAALRQARLLWTAAQLAQRPDHPDPQSRFQSVSTADAAFRHIAIASELAYRNVEGPAKPAQLLPAGTTVEAHAPVRLDLAGGWSDTPPYCYEEGGHVINVAINLHNAPPIRTIAEVLDEPVYILESHDLNARAQVTTIPPEVPLSDPFALHKLALNMVGLGGRLKSRGIRVVTECRVPKGSGLGTSSILAATLLAGLHQACGRRASPATLYEQTLLLEQRLSTGGGWQDQVGGIEGGIKSALTNAEMPQRLSVEVLDVPGSLLDELESRLVVFFSGQQRLAKDILRRVIGRWIGREPEAVRLLRDARAGAAALRSALLAGRLNSGAKHIDRYWEIKKSLYAGSTTPHIDLMLMELRPHYQAAGLSGAGGGGFGYFLCKSPAQARLLTAKLTDRFSRPGALGAVYPATINRKGLSVTVRRS